MRYSGSEKVRISVMVSGDLAMVLTYAVLAANGSLAPLRLAA